MLSIRLIATFSALAMVAGAAPVTWVFSGVSLTDGGQITGSFTFNADAGTPCSTGVTPCGVYSNVHITTTTGSAVTGHTYAYVCGTDVPACSGVSPDSTEVLFLTSNLANQTGMEALAVFFTGIGATPPAGLTDAGGSLNISNSSASVGAGQEATCSNSSCGSPAPPIRSTSGGVVVGSLSVPTLSEWGQILLAVLLVGITTLRLRQQTA
jgi:hypothetical protein